MSEEKLKSLLDPEIDRTAQGSADGRTHTNLGIYAVRKRLDYVQMEWRRWGLFQKKERERKLF